MVMPNIGFFLVYLVEIGAIVAIYWKGLRYNYHKDEVTYIDFSELSTEFLIRRLEPPTGKVEWYWIPIPTMKWTISSL